MTLFSYFIRMQVPRSLLKRKEYTETNYNHKSKQEIHSKFSFWASILFLLNEVIKIKKCFENVDDQDET